MAGREKDLVYVSALVDWKFISKSDLIDRVRTMKDLGDNLVSERIKRFEDFTAISQRESHSQARKAKKGFHL